MRDQMLCCRGNRDGASRRSRSYSRKQPPGARRARTTSVRGDGWCDDRLFCGGRQIVEGEGGEDCAVGFVRDRDVADRFQVALDRGEPASRQCVLRLLQRIPLAVDADDVEVGSFFEDEVRHVTDAAAELQHGLALIHGVRDQRRQNVELLPAGGVSLNRIFHGILPVMRCSALMRRQGADERR